MSNLYNVKAHHPDYPTMSSAKALDYIEARRWARRAIIMNGMHWVEIKAISSVKNCQTIHSSRRASWILNQAKAQGDVIIQV